MASPVDASPPTFRPEWLKTVVARCQLFAGTASQPSDSGSIPELAASFLEAVPDAHVMAEDLALRSLLMDLAARWAAYLHERAHPELEAGTCSFDTRQTLDPFITDRSQDSKKRFLQWAHTFSMAFTRAHPVSVARRAEAIIRTQQCKSVDAVSLARIVGVSPRVLRREFRRTFAMPLVEYVQRDRLIRALEMMLEQPGKIEPIALQVGYASKKNFYKVFKKALEMTPTAFLRLPTDAARRHVDDLRLPIDNARAE